MPANSDNLMIMVNDEPSREISAVLRSFHKLVMTFFDLHLLSLPFGGPDIGSAIAVLSMVH